MVEPLREDVRRELKRIHDGLLDEDIDRMEELIAMRFTLDPVREADQLRAVDREREQLLRERMPRFDEVYQRVRAGETADRPSTEVPYTVEAKGYGPDDDDDGSSQQHERGASTA